MRIAYTPEQERLRQELRAYFAGLMTPEVRAALSGGDEGLGDGEAYRQVVRQLGRDGWLALSWPAEHGGRGGTMLDQLIFTDEAAIARVPVPFLTINTVGPTIMRYGTPEQKAFYLPRIAAGELHFSIGYSEPEAGTDLAALRTTAVRDGEEYVIDGQKMWTSLIQYADYVLARLPDRSRGGAAPGAVHRHRADVGRGLLLDAGADGRGRDDQRHLLLLGAGAGLVAGGRGEPGLAADHQPAQPRAGRADLGGAGDGGAGRRAGLGRVDPAGQRGAGDRRGVGPAQPGPGARQGGVPEASQLAGGLGWRGVSGPADASATKVFGTEFAVEAYRLLMEVLGPAAVVRSGSPGEVLAGRIERAHRAALILTFGGGTNEVQRDIIAAAGLGLPFSRR